MSELLVVPAVGTSPTLAISDEAQQLKSRLLITAAATGVITSESERDRAIKVAGNIQAHVKDVEAERIKVKKPFFQTGQAIDVIARDHVTSLNTELRRINGLVGQFEFDRKETARLAEEELRKEQERLAALVAASQDQLELSAEDKGRNLEAALAAEEQLDGAAERLEKLRVAADAAKPTGGALRKDWDIEVLDIKALYAAHPQCVELTARNMAIKDLLKTGITPAGVRATPKVAYAARATTTRGTLK